MKTFFVTGYNARLKDSAWRLAQLLMLGLVLAATGCGAPDDAQIRREKYLDEYETMQAGDVHEDFLALVKERPTTPHAEFLDWLREFAHANSEDENDTERSEDGIRNHKHLKRMTRMWAQRLETGGGEKPKLKCDHTAKALAAVLENVGIASRLVHVFALKPDGSANDHSFLEVRNPETGAWEILDAYYNIYMVNTTTGRRAGALELVMGDLDEYEPANAEGRGWEILGDKRGQYVRSLFNGLMYDNRRTQERSVLVVNSRRYPDGLGPKSPLYGPYMAHIAKMLYAPKVIVN